MSRSYPNRPIVGVGAVVFRDDRVLLIRRGKPPRMGDWSLPGGMQEIGETVFEAAAREVREETGVTISDIALIDVVDSITRDDDARVQFHYTLVDVVAKWRSGEPAGGSDAMHAEFMSFDEVSKIVLWRETHRIIAKAREMCGL